MHSKNTIKHLIDFNASVKDALTRLNELSEDAILFVTSDDRKLKGSLTDGDIRRGLINGLTSGDPISKFIKTTPAFLTEGGYSADDVERLREKQLRIVPILNKDGEIIDVINFRLVVSVLPVNALLMAGGKGQRLLPLTKETPKSLLKVGDKPIIEHNVDRFINFGIDNIHISINYLGDQIAAYFGDGSSKGISIKYVREDKPLGTIGSILLVDDFSHDDILVMNSDIITDINFADFYKTFKNSGADMAVACTSYNVDVPYAVIETDSNNMVTSLKEKPKYTYHSNGGIYFIKKAMLGLIPQAEFFDITDLMELMIRENNKIVTYPIVGYWLDIGRHEDYAKAQTDIHHIFKA